MRFAASWCICIDTKVDCAQMTPLERAQWHMMMASSAYRLTEMYFKAHGKNPRAHGKLEIEKVRQSYAIGVYDFARLQILPTRWALCVVHHISMIHS